MMLSTISEDAALICWSNAYTISVYILVYTRSSSQSN